MSDADKHEDQYLASPAVNATPTKGRGGGRGRGRGRGRRRAVGKIRAPAPPKKPVPGGRRGRIKQYTDPHVQAAYERQREVKSTYLAIISHVKPALEELAARSIETLKSDPEAHRKVPEYRAIMDELAGKKKAVTSAAKTWYDVELADLDASCAKEDEFSMTQFRNAIEDEEERFIDAQLERLRLLEEMHDLDLPPDLRANDYQYKQLSQKEFTERGTYHAYKDDVLVPYPSRVPGTDMFQKARDAAAEAAQAVSGTKKITQPKVVTRGRPNGIKRRAQAQPDSQPGAKRPTTRSAARAEKDDDEDDVDTPDATPAESSSQQQEAIAPARHIMGLLAAAVDDSGPADSNAATPRHSPDVEEEDDRADRSAMPPRMRTPEPPKGLGEFDEQGAALMQRGTKANNRFAVKPAFQFDQLDIGFRDSTNDHSKIKNASARGKFLDQPNTDHFYYDPLLWNYDARNQKKGDLDKVLVAKFGVHAKYGVFVPGSRNRTESPDAGDAETHPVVFLTPSGETLHASRSYQAVVTEKNVENDIMLRKVMATIDTFAESNPDVSIKARKPRDKEVIPKEYSGPSLGLLHREATEETSVSEAVEGSPTPASAEQAEDWEQDAADGLSPLVMAAFLASAEDAKTQRAETPPKTVSRPYDAIRDVFTSSPPKPPAEPPRNLALLAEAAFWGPQYSHGQPHTTGPPADQGQPQNPYQLPQLAPAQNPSAAQHQYVQESPYMQSRAMSSARDRDGLTIRPDAYPEPPMPPRNITTPQSAYQHRYEAPGTAGPHHEQYQMPMERDMHPRHMHQPGPESMIDPRLRGLDHERPPPYYDPEPRHHVPPGYPPGPAPMHNPALTPAPPHPSAYGAPPPSQQPRRDYPASSTTLPPLRPPRQLGQPYESPAEPMGHPHQRISSISSANPFYPPGPPRQFHNSFGPPEQPPQMMSAGPSPHYGPPPAGGYRQGTLSPTYSSAQIPFQSLGHTPPPATPPQSAASLPGRRATFQHYAPVPSPQSGNAKYRKLEPAPIPPHRMGWNNEPQLRTVGYNPTEDIKDYSAVEPLPGRGPTFIRGWNVSSGARKRGSRGREEKDESR